MKVVHGIVINFKNGDNIYLPQRQIADLEFFGISKGFIRNTQTGDLIPKLFAKYIVLALESTADRDAVWENKTRKTIWNRFNARHDILCIEVQYVDKETLKSSEETYYTSWKNEYLGVVENAWETSYECSQADGMYRGCYVIEIGETAKGNPYEF